ncbi:MAG: hypothetical protein ACYCXG_10755 [Acidiferrobacter sp.]
MGGKRLIAVIQQRKANDPKRSFKVGIVSVSSSALCIALHKADEQTFTAIMRTDGTGLIPDLPAWPR